jgi:hemoglobin/transferrin/lactoferrin receptor protein
MMYIKCMFIFRHVSRVGEQGTQGVPCPRNSPSAPSADSCASPQGPAEARACRHRGAATCLAGAVLVTAAGAAWAENALEEETARLEPMVVISTRSPRPISEVVGMVSVLGDSDIQAGLVSNEEGLWRYMPAIQVESAGSRFSARSISIRGIGGNRVLIEQDGIPIQERLIIGQLGYAGRSGAEMDFIRRIEVLRGPASSLYGSKAIGGVVAVSTFDPDDLALPGLPGGRVSGLYASDWDSFGASAIGAWQGETAGFLLGASHRQGSEPDRSANPPETDRVDRDRTAMLAKLTLSDRSDRRLRLTLEADRDEAKSEMNSIAGQGRFASSTSLTGDDRVTRAGAALDGFTDLKGVRIEGGLFLRETETRQDTLDLRENLARPVAIERAFRYDTEITGARLRAVRELEAAAVRHRLMVGVEYSRSERDQLRDATQTGLVDGESTKVVLGERFPKRDFPLTVSHETGVFLQDEIDWRTGRWTVIPSVRFDRTRITVRDDEGWRQANPGVDPAELTESDVSPRLGVLWRPAPGFQAWGQVASGFRAPPAEDLNIGLDIPLFRTRALPNPDLKSESSLGWEAGVRMNSRGAWASVAAFWTDYDDFIVSLVPLGVDPATGTLLFQSQNLDRARIQGVEFEAGAPLGLLSPRLDSLQVGFNGFWARSEDRRTGDALDDVGPPSAVIFLDWVADSGRWDLRLSGLFTRGQAREGGAVETFRVPGHGILDVAAAWHVSERLTFRAGLFNLTDRTWWRWGEARRLPADDPLIPSLSAPGRSASVSFNLGLGPGRY